MDDQNKTQEQLITELAELRQRITELEMAEAQRRQVEAELNERINQQAVVAELGQRVLAGVDLSALLKEVSSRVAETLKVEYCQILELLPDRDALLLRAGVGWPSRLIGFSTVDARPDSQMGYTLFSSEPVIVEDLAKDTRFSELSLLAYDIVSGMSVIIDGEHWPFGVLGIHTKQRRIFNTHDIHFLQSVANLLATAIAHKRAEDALQEAHSKLELRVMERTADLQAANEELKTFTYMISHDLRAPLVNIRGFAGELSMALEDVQSALQTLVPQLDKAQQQAITTAFMQEIPEALNFINSSVNRMNEFINAILKLSRLGRRELNLEPLDMPALVQSTLETLAHQIEQRGVQVTVDPLPNIVADRTSLEQIFSNILTNAISYLEPNRPGEVEISGDQTERETIFRVRDNGRGIAAEDMSKIFELFRRVGNQNVPGEGMGLAYVRTLLRRYGGRIWCNSEPGVGSVFSFSIPHHVEQGGVNA